MTSPVLLPVRRIVTAPAPAAGAGFTLPNNGTGPWIVRMLHLTLATSAAVANRRVLIAADDQTSVFFRTRAESVQAAGLAQFYSAFPGAPSGVAASDRHLLAWPTDGLTLDVGWRLIVAVDLMDAADALSNVAALVDEYPQGGAGAWHSGPAPYLTEGQ